MAHILNSTTRDTNPKLAVVNYY